MKKRPELLAPVGNWATLNSVKDFTDSVYFGVQEYNMRANAQNFQKEDLPEIVEICHDHEPPIQTYLCTNILIYESELQSLENLLKLAQAAGIDAVIVHDIAAIQKAREIDIPFHISTQANISNSVSARFFEDLGAERVILARELSLQQIKTIKEKLSKTEIECFVHGSCCTSISGRCYLSAEIMGSQKYSANRGNCTQPCRRKWRIIDDSNNELIYDGKYFLNTKDLCMIEYIPQLIDAHIDTFKIEGRMKNAHYVKTVTQYYKEALDCYYKGCYTKEKAKEWLKELKKVYNRGFHTGFYFGHPKPEDIELERRGNISPYKKEYLGTVQSYHKQSKTGNILIENINIPVKKGDKILISGKQHSFIQTLKHINLNGKKCDIKSKTVRNKKDTPILINVRFDKSVKKSDKIYKISRQ
ncbi:MAG: peptidase U32 family protein [Promethearchaeia archaeon]